MSWIPKKNPIVFVAEMTVGGFCAHCRSPTMLMMRRKVMTSHCASFVAVSAGDVGVEPRPRNQKQKRTTMPTVTLISSSFCDCGCGCHGYPSLFLDRYLWMPTTTRIGWNRSSFCHCRQRNRNHHRYHADDETWLAADPSDSARSPRPSSLDAELQQQRTHWPSQRHRLPHPLHGHHHGGILQVWTQGQKEVLMLMPMPMPTPETNPWQQCHWQYLLPPRDRRPPPA